MTEQELITKGKARGWDDARISKVISEAKQSGIITNIELPKSRETKKQASITDVLFPTSQTSGPISKAFEASEAPRRILGQLRGFESTDPKSAFLRPEFEKIKPGLERVAEAARKTPKTATAGPDPLRFAMENAPKIGEFALVDLISDPLTYLGGAGALKKPVRQAIGKAITLPEVLAGKSVQGAGESSMRAGMKIEKAVARKAGETVSQGQKNITENISKYNLESPIGGWAKIKERAGDEIRKADKKVDEIISDAVKKGQSTQLDVENVFLGTMEDIKNGVPGITPDKIDRANEIISNLYDAYGKHRGVKGVVTLDVANQIKKDLGKGQFKKGAANIMQDPVEAQVKEILYLKMRDEIGKIVPDVAKENKKMYDLISVKRAADDALGKSPRLSDILVTGFGGVAGASAAGIPGAAAMIPAWAAKKALGKGRGASMLIKSGKVLKKYKPVTKIGAGGAIGARELEQFEEVQ